MKLICKITPQYCPDGTPWIWVHPGEGYAFSGREWSVLVRLGRGEIRQDCLCCNVLTVGILTRRWTEPKSGHEGRAFASVFN